MVSPSFQPAFGDSREYNTKKSGYLALKWGVLGRKREVTPSPNKLWGNIHVFSPHF